MFQNVAHDVNKKRNYSSNAKMFLFFFHALWSRWRGGIFLSAFINDSFTSLIHLILNPPDSIWDKKLKQEFTMVVIFYGWYLKNKE